MSNFIKNQMVQHNETGLIGQVISVTDWVVNVRWPSGSAEHLDSELSPAKIGELC